MLIEARRQRAIVAMAFGGREVALTELSAAANDAVVSGDGRTAASILQNIAVMLVSDERVDDAAAAVAAGEELAAGSDDASLVWDLRRQKAVIEAILGRREVAAESFRWLLDNYSAQEKDIGDPDLIVGWSRDKAGVFDEALRFFLAVGNVQSALGVALSAKARVQHVRLDLGSANTCASISGVLLAD